MEWLDDGQRIQKYSIDIWTGSAWKRIYFGQAIGHKKIDSFPAVTAGRVRLNILSSTSAAIIREFQLYDVEDARSEK
jgi:alpha-L-fucosidase